MAEKETIKLIMRLWHSRGIERTPSEVMSKVRRVMRSKGYSKKSAIEFVLQEASTRTHNED